MKTFIVAVAVLALLVTGVVLGSHIGVRRIDEYIDRLPGANASCDTAAEMLALLGESVNDDLLLLNSLFPHDRTDMLITAIARTEAAARITDEVEYAILRAELESILREMERDLAPHLDDIV